MSGGLAEHLLAATPFALVALDAQDRVQWLNAAAEDLLNIGAGAARQAPLATLARLPDIAGLPLGSQSLTAYACRVEPVRGVPRTLDLDVRPLQDPPGWRLLTLTPATRDPGHGKARPASLAAAGAAAMLAHEIKNPLAGIKGAAQLLGARQEDGPLTALICEEVDRIARLLDEMESFTDSRPTTRTRNNVHALIDHARRVVSTAHPVEFREAYDPSLPHVLVAADSIVQVLINLFVNAVEASASSPARIEVQTRYRHGARQLDREGRRVAVPIELSVIDDGAGPPPALADHMFEPFVTSKTSGRGLGLALVDKLVRDNGGDVRFERVDDRSVFRILLPAADPA